MGLGNLGLWEMVMIGLLVLVVFGPRRLPEIARSMGKALREFRRGVNEIQRELEEAERGARVRDERPAPRTTPREERARAAVHEGLDGVASLDADRVLRAAAGVIEATLRSNYYQVDAAGEPVLIDELLTPDSSRFWPADSWQPGENPPSFDKQFIRDWLEEQDWDKTAPGPEVPDEIVQESAARYREAVTRLTRRTRA
jgi:TatA/E family protein of Tat protein translocase